MNNITFCIPTKNNLRYLKSCIKSILINSTYQNKILVYIDSDNDGTEDWLKENNIPYIKNNSNIPKGIAYGYNRCIEQADTELVCMFHADMYMGKGFDEGILKLIKPNTVVSGTRIEPPLHPKGKEKIVENFGMYPEDLKKNEFDEFVKNLRDSNKDKYTRGIFAPWCIYKVDIESIGMHDEMFHSYHEDSDIFNRFILKNYEIVQSWESYVYHFTCRGGQFQDGVEKITSDESFHKMKNNAMKNFLRKWGTWIRNDEFQFPILSPKYEVGIRIKNADLDLIRLLEPWCDKLYIDNLSELAYKYNEEEQKNTKYDLKKRIFSSHLIPDTNILIDIDRNTFAQEDFNILQMMPDIIKDTNETGIFEISNMKVEVALLQEYQNELIDCRLGDKDLFIPIK